MMKKCCESVNPDLGIIIIRLALAMVFIVHGLMKFQAMEKTIGFFGSLGFAPFFAYFVASVEFFGGILLLLGVFTSWTAIALAFVMIFAILLVKIGKPFAGGYEFELTLMLVSLGLSLLGTGKYTVCPCRKSRK